MLKTISKTLLAVVAMSAWVSTTPANAMDSPPCAKPGTTVHTGNGRTNNYYSRPCIDKPLPVPLPVTVSEVVKKIETTPVGHPYGEDILVSNTKSVNDYSFDFQGNENLQPGVITKWDNIQYPLIDGKTEDPYQAFHAFDDKTAKFVRWTGCDETFLFPDLDRETCFIHSNDDSKSRPVAVYEPIGENTPNLGATSKSGIPALNPVNYGFGTGIATKDTSTPTDRNSVSSLPEKQVVINGCGTTGIKLVNGSETCYYPIEPDDESDFPAVETVENKGISTEETAPAIPPIVPVTVTVSAEEFYHPKPVDENDFTAAETKETAQVVKQVVINGCGTTGIKLVKGSETCYYPIEPDDDIMQSDQPISNAVSEKISNTDDIMTPKIKTVLDCKGHDHFIGDTTHVHSCSDSSVSFGNSQKELNTLPSYAAFPAPQAHECGNPWKHGDQSVMTCTRDGQVLRIVRPSQETEEIRFTFSNSVESKDVATEETAKDSLDIGIPTVEIVETPKKPIVETGETESEVTEIEVSEVPEKDVSEVPEKDVSEVPEIEETAPAIPPIVPLTVTISAEEFYHPKPVDESDFTTVVTDIEVSEVPEIKVVTNEVVVTDIEVSKAPEIEVNTAQAEVPEIEVNTAQAEVPEIEVNTAQAVVNEIEVSEVTEIEVVTNEVDTTQVVVTDIEVSEVTEIEVNTAQAEVPEIEVNTAQAEVPEIEVNTAQAEVPEIEVDTTQAEVPEIEVDTTQAEVPEIEVDTTQAEVPEKISPHKPHLENLAFITSPRLWKNHWQTVDCYNASKEVSDSDICRKSSFWTKGETIKNSDGYFTVYSGGIHATSDKGLIGLMFEAGKGYDGETIMVGPYFSIPLKNYWMLHGQALIGQTEAADTKSRIWAAEAAITGYRKFNEGLLFGPHMVIKTIRAKNVAVNSLITGFRGQKDNAYIQGDAIFNLNGGDPMYKFTAGIAYPIHDSFTVNVSGIAMTNTGKPSYGGMVDLSLNF